MINRLSDTFDPTGEQTRNSVRHPIPAQRKNLGTVSDEDRKTLKHFILTTIDRKIREALKKLSIEGEETSKTNKTSPKEDSSDSDININRNELNSTKDESLDGKIFSISKLKEKENRELNGHENTGQFIESVTNLTGSQIKETDCALENLTLKFDYQFECSICCEKYDLMNSESFGCSHLFCKKCMCLYLTTSIVEGRVDSLKCPENGCDTETTEKFVEKVVPFKVFERYYELRLKKAVGKMDDIFYCPNPGCQAMVPCEIDVGLGVCYECDFNFCTNCLKPFHGTIDCYLDEHETHEMISKFQQQTENVEKRKEQNILSESFIRKSFKKCPGCKSDVEKQDGCNHMICTACQTHFCWLCLIVFANDSEMQNHFITKCVLFKYNFTD